MIVVNFIIYLDILILHDFENETVERKLISLITKVVLTIDLSPSTSVSVSH
jgi:hypothetical protein